MQAVSKPVTSLSIARHALQSVLHRAVEASPDRCCGVIGLSNSLIRKALTLPNSASDTLHHCEIGADHAAAASESCDLRHIAEQWRKSGITQFGTFFTATDEAVPAVSELEQFEAVLKRDIPELPDMPIIHLALMLNTAGCLEAFAYQIHQGLPVAVALILEEDGQQQ
ncbi:MAG: hypothetical protein RQ867_04645 [Mariprofundaceae bacterium]|nr:hypothetical protein [Mariprofundaceae bacterium]